MRLLWLCNMAPGKVKENISGEKSGGGLWVDHVLAGLRQREALNIHILCPGNGDTGELDEKCSYATFREGLPYVYLPELEKQFQQELLSFQPDVIHIWGTEYSHTLAMVNAAQAAEKLDCVAVSIQGLCSVISRHYTEGIPHRVQTGFTFRDFVRQDNIAQQQKKFVKRGELEIAAIQKVRHVIGRTHWDRACTSRIQPQVQYHFCKETLRKPFYDGQWTYEGCKKHRIFASSCSYPVKGFHYLLEAFAEVLREYPDAVLTVTGNSYLEQDGWKGALRKTSYQRYLQTLTRKYRLEKNIEFLGSLSAEEMKAAYLDANVFVLPSTIENSPNSLGEAMLLGVPCVASDVGGVTSMMEHKTEGYVYQSTAPYMLAHYIKQVFAMEEQAPALGAAARLHAVQNHDPEKNLRDLLKIYEEIAKG